MRPLRIIWSTAAVVAAVATLQAQPRPERSSAENLRNLGQAIMMYAADYKGHVPPDLGKLAKYVGGDLDVFVSPRRVTRMPEDVRAKPESSAEWFNTSCDYVLTVPPGTRLSRLRQPEQFPLVVEKPSLHDEGTVAILYADGHVVDYARSARPSRPGEGPAGVAPLAAPATSRPAALVPAPRTTQPATSAVVGKLPRDLPTALFGTWRITLDPFVEATYRFNGDGTFSLTFAHTAPAANPAEAREHGAGGTWALDGAKLTMTNTSSNTPYTVVGETEEAEIIGMNDTALAMRTTNRKGAEEVLVFVKVVPFAKGKHDNPKIIGTWQADNALLVLAESGLFVMNSGPGTMKGEWSQRGDQLMVLFTLPPVAAGRRRIDPPPKNREVLLTIDHADDTTLVLSGAFLQRGDAPMTFLRVK
jgi:prepilin-type processing-associated H-X9-DG protein